MASEAQPFVHLRVHSAYSLLEGALTIAKLAALARADGAPALALTDSNNLFGALEFSETLAEAGIQPIIGLTLSLTFAAERDTAMSPAANSTGRAPTGASRFLPRTRPATPISCGFRPTPISRPAKRGEVVTSIADLAARAEGLIALTGGFEGPIDARARRRQCRARPRAHRSASDNFRRPALCRASAPWPAAGEGGRAAAAQSRL